MPRWLDAGRLHGVALDQRGARALHRAATQPWALAALALCSRCADAPPWCVLAMLLPLLDTVHGTRVAQQMLLLGSVNLLLYWALKRSTRRRRPFELCDDIRACMRAPDAFSFPSGHTLHAVAFALLLSAAYPAWAAPLWGFAALVSLSRVVLGLHYPSDVLAGAALGTVTAAWVRWLA